MYIHTVGTGQSLEGRKLLTHTVTWMSLEEPQLSPYEDAAWLTP